MKKTNDPSSSESKEFHRRKFRLKVNLPKEKSEDENDSPQRPPQLQKKHFCVICNNQFNSGKAYGGHVRIHSTEYSNKGITKMRKMKKKRKSCEVKKEKEKETDMIRADVEGKIRCCLCGKEFQTMHSLFGHMRRHPDRSWKGVRPPPPPEKFKLGCLDDDDDYDGMSRSTVMSDVAEDIQEAACILMLLNYNSSNYWDGIKKAIESPKSEVRSSSCYIESHEIVHGDDGGMDDKDLIIDMKVKVDKPRNEAKRPLGFDLNQPYHEHGDHPYSCWN